MPGELMPAFEQFKRDFEQVAGQWIARREESEASMLVAREGLRRYLADGADPDEYGVGRVDRLRHVFAFWRDLARRECSQGVAVVPVLGFDAERRIADGKWKEKGE